MDLALSRYLGVAFSAFVLGEGHDVLRQQGRVGSIGDVVLHKAGVATARVRGAAVLIQSGLEQGIEGLPVRGKGEAFETLVVRTAGDGIFGIDDLVGVVRGRRVGREGNAAIAARDQSVRRSNGGEHCAGRTEVVYVGSIFVADPERAVRGENKPFGVQRDSRSAGAAAAEAVAIVVGDRQRREAGGGLIACDVGVEASDRDISRSRQQDGVLVGNIKVWRGRILSGSRGLWGERDGELVDSILVVQGAFRIPDHSLLA